MHGRSRQLQPLAGELSFGPDKIETLWGAVLKVAGLRFTFHQFDCYCESGGLFFPSSLFRGDRAFRLRYLHALAASVQSPLLYSGYHLFRCLNWRCKASQCAQNSRCGAGPASAEHKISRTFSYLYRFYLADPPCPYFWWRVASVTCYLSCSHSVLTKLPELCSASRNAACSIAHYCRKSISVLRLCLKCIYCSRITVGWHALQSCDKSDVINHMTLF